RSGQKIGKLELVRVELRDLLEPQRAAIGVLHRTAALLTARGSKCQHPLYHMGKLIRRSALSAVLVGYLVGSAESQARRTLPRTPDGKPNLNGIWQVLNTANFDLEAHMAKAAMAMRPGPVVPVPAKEVLALGAVGAVPSGVGVVEGGAIPYKPEALAKKKENQENWLSRDPEIKCYLPGVPRATYMPFPFQILHSDKAIFFTYEYAGAVRDIFLKNPGPAQIDSWMGQSVGRWEGDTLV